MRPRPMRVWVHVEDGAWIFRKCYGSPNFLKWIEPPLVNTKIGATNRYGDRRRIWKRRALP